MTDEVLAEIAMDWRTRWAAQKRLGWSLWRRIKYLAAG